ncbi:hypothetical protein AAG570_008455 [Ranatra chinensis]|uniref:Uncharacterized protein n=1 Tax=Ranatra chinensis TaxID=642074 RepID=A0ABD0YR06_9HEMI
MNAEDGDWPKPFAIKKQETTEIAKEVIIASECLYHYIDVHNELRKDITVTAIVACQTFGRAMPLSETGASLWRILCPSCTSLFYGSCFVPEEGARIRERRWVANSCALRPIWPRSYRNDEVGTGQDTSGGESSVRIDPGFGERSFSMWGCQRFLGARCTTGVNSRTASSASSGGLRDTLGSISESADWKSRTVQSGAGVGSRDVARRDHLQRDHK